MEVVTRKLPEGPFTICPIGDIQYGAAGCDVEKLRGFIDVGLEQGWYFIGMGDYLDTFSPSNKAALRIVPVYESGVAMIDAAVVTRIEELADILRASGRWLGCVKGDHDWTFKDGQPSDALLARKIGAPYLGTSGIVMLYPEGVKVPLRVWVFHGAWASSVNDSFVTNKLKAKMGEFDCDLYLAGHGHQLGTVRRDVLFPYTEKRKTGIGHRDVLAVATGSFLNGYQAGTRNAAGWPEGSYIETRGLSPSPTGAPVIQVTPTVKHGTVVYEMRGSV